MKPNKSRGFPSKIILLILFFGFLAVGIFLSINSPSKVSEVSPIKPTSIPLAIAKIGDVSIPIEIADTPEKRSLGLGHRNSLPADQGMLFVFGEGKRPVRFWMKGMEFPLDMLFISDGKVFQIVANAQPEPGVSDLNLKAYISEEPVDYVLEVNGGFAEKHGIKKGDSFSF